MDLGVFIKTCWAIIVFTFMLMIVFAFVETIINKIRHSKDEEAINEAYENYIEYLIEKYEGKEEFDDNDKKEE